MPSKKPTTRVKKAAERTKMSRVTAVLGPRLTVVVVICVLASGMLIAARQQSRSTDMVSATLRSDTVAVSPATPKVVDASSAPVVASADASPVAKALAVTITGCLERTDATFRLKETSGADAPKARSWKSGFLKKGSASIEVVDPAHTLKLADNVGRRVSVTGTLVDREMQVRSLRRVAPSCSARAGA
jgi:hypothetical protein